MPPLDSNHDHNIRTLLLRCYTNTTNISTAAVVIGRSQWPRGLRRRSLAACLLRLWVRIPPGTWMSVCCECCVLSGRVHCGELITRPEESYRLCCVVVCDLETSNMRRPWPTGGLLHQKTKQTVVIVVVVVRISISINTNNNNSSSSSTY